MLCAIPAFSFLVKTWIVRNKISEQKLSRMPFRSISHSRGLKEVQRHAGDDKIQEHSNNSQ